jgi:hypothetical protein
MPKRKNDGTRKNTSRFLVLFPDQRIMANRKNLPKFKPVNLRELVEDATTAEFAEQDLSIITALRRRVEAQEEKLLRCLGVDPADPRAWHKGFHFLALYHHTLGHLAWYPKRSSQQAAKWTPNDDLNLLREVTLLKNQGVSERSAIKKLAANPKKYGLFPYRTQSQRHDPKKNEQENRADALRARLAKLKSSANLDSLLEMLCGVRRNKLSLYEGVLHDLDNHFGLSDVVKNHSRAK